MHDQVIVSNFFADKFALALILELCTGMKFRLDLYPF